MLKDFNPRLYQETILATCNEKNTLVVLPTGMGKCLTYDTPILFTDGSIKKIGEFVESNLKNKKNIVNSTKEHKCAKLIKKVLVPSLNEKLKIKNTRISYIHKIKCVNIIKIQTQSGAYLTATPEHPLLKLNNKLKWERTDHLKLGDFVAVPKYLNKLNLKEKEINLIELFKNHKKNLSLWIQFDKIFMKENNVNKIICYDTAPKQIKDNFFLNEHVKKIFFKGTKCNNQQITNIKKLDKYLLYWLGLFIAEGRFHGSVQFFNKDKILLNEFSQISKKYFGLSPKKIEGGLEIKSTALVLFLKKLFNLDSSQNSFRKDLNNTIMKLNNKKTNYLLKGLFDGDGNVRKKDGVVEYTSASKDLTNKICFLLIRNGIRGRVKEIFRRATNSKNSIKKKYYRIRISSKEDLVLFYKHINFNSLHKKANLKKHLSKNKIENTNIDIISAGSIIKEIRKELKLSSTRHKDFPVSSIDIYERKKRNISKKNLIKIVKIFKKSVNKNTSKKIIKKIHLLKYLSESEILWDKVISIQNLKEKWVYDISLKENYNFIAGFNGGIVAHNTAVSFLLTIQRLKNYPKSKILILAPTRPLIEQHLNTFKRHLDVDESKFVLFTGMISPDKRAELWKDAKFIFSTPQGMENDIISRRINLEEVSLLVFDEAHRATGDYSYGFIAKQYNKISKYPRILALTASPGSDVEKIEEVCKNLHIEDVEIRTDTDPDVKPYVQEIKATWVEVELPEEFLEIKRFLEASFRSKLVEVKRKGFIKSASTQNMGKKDILGLQAALHAELSRGNRDYEMMKSVSLLAEAMKVQHALELLETQGISSLYKYLEKLQTESKTTKVKAVKNLVQDLNFKSAFIKTRNLYENDVEHPKLTKLKEIIEKEIKNKTKIIIFNQYRDSALKIHSEISKIKNVKAEIFVGQMKKGETGMSQKKQKEMLDKFTNEEFNILISTSIGEEGLDIPEVDLVIFYEPIPSAIRHIQRRGRTGRQKKGKVIILMAKKTRDEGYRWSAHHKERRMHTTLNKLKGKLGLKFEKQQPTLMKYVKGDDVKIFADVREKASGVIKELLEIGAELDLKTLKIGDYVLSKRVAVEIKTVEDFVNSIIDGRLLQQIKGLKINFERPLIIIEGTRDIYSVRKIFPTAIQGMLATIAVSYGIPILQTKNYKETASLLHTIAKREQDETIREFSLHGDKKPLTLKEQQEYIISALPNIGPTLSKPLLKELGSVKKVINATEAQLKKIELIGPKKAKKIKEVVDSKYDQ